MSELVLLTSAGCHLCEHGRAVLRELSAAGRLTWRGVDDDSPEGRRLSGGAPPLRPVLLSAEGRVLAYGRLSSRRLRTVLAQAGDGD